MRNVKAMSKEYQKPELSLVELERYYWRNLVRGEPVYGADTTGSLTEDSVEEFKLVSTGCACNCSELLID